jgi:hypothetical protein
VNPIDGSGDDDTWIVEIETLCDSRHVASAVDALHDWSSHLQP